MPGGALRGADPDILTNGAIRTITDPDFARAGAPETGARPDEERLNERAGDRTRIYGI